MKKMNLNEMLAIEGGDLTPQGQYITRLMCGMAVGICFWGFLAPIAAAPAIGCAIGLLAEYN